MSNSNRNANCNSPAREGNGIASGKAPQKSTNSVFSCVTRRKKPKKKDLNTHNNALPSSSPPPSSSLQPQRSGNSRTDVLANLLEQFLRGQLMYSTQITFLPDNYFLIDEIVALPQFRAQNFTADELIQAVHRDPYLRFSVRGSKVRLKPKELNDRSTTVSKKLSWILRHAAEQCGLSYDDAGYLYLSDILKLPTFNDVTLEEIERVVQTNSKKRFEMRFHPVDNRLQIRALQGHSVPIPDLGLTPIINPEDYPVVIHGTYFRNWDSIRKEGLKRMSRTHIHFAPGEVGEAGVISGMRSSAEIIIYINLPLALQEGYKFFISNNNVILCDGGPAGCLPPKYFLYACQRSPRVLLPLKP